MIQNQLNQLSTDIGELAALSRLLFLKLMNDKQIQTCQTELNNLEEIATRNGRMNNSNYVADHILRIERRFKDNPKAQADSLWRIASATNLFQDMGDILTEEQQAQTWKFINEFKVSQEGEKALKELENFQIAMETN